MAVGLAVILALAAPTVTPAGAATTPASWDPQVEPIAQAVAGIRALEWKHPVDVRFLSDAAFRARISKSSEPRTEKQRRALEKTEAYLRSLGLAAADVDLEAALTEYAGDSVLAYYDPGEKTITVRGEDLTPMVKVTLAHELAHALVDQHFGLARLARSARTSSQSTAVDALVEGDASSVESQYLGTFSPADRESVEATEQAWRDEAPTTAAKGSAPLPEVLGALYEAPYVLGPHVVRAIATAKGSAGLERAFRRAPASDEEVFDPLEVDGLQQPVKVPAPALRTGERRFGRRDDFGALTTYLLLASRLDPVAAMDATEGWAGDSAITFRRDGRDCLRVNVAGDDAERTQRLADALRAVVTQLPGNSALVETTDAAVVELTTCDPGAASTEPAPYAARAMALLDLRNWSATEALASGLPTPTARCISGAVVTDPGWAGLADPDAEGPTDLEIAALRARYLDIVRSCQSG